MTTAYATMSMIAGRNDIDGPLPARARARVFDYTNPCDQKLMSIRFHFKSGAVKDMHLREDVGGIDGAARVLRKIDQILDEKGNYRVFDNNDITQNFIVYDDDLSFTELVER